MLFLSICDCFMCWFSSTSNEYFLIVPALNVESHHVGNCANTILSSSILSRNYYSPRTGQSSQTLTKITKHIEKSLRTISIKFLLVIITLYKQRIGDSRYRTQSLRLRRLRFTARTGIIIEHGASFQTSPKINDMLITRLICIQWKSSRLLSPVSTFSARNAWDHARPLGVRPTKENASIFRVSLVLLKQGRLNNTILNIWLEPVLCLVLLCLLPVVTVSNFK